METRTIGKQLFRHISIMVLFALAAAAARRPVIICFKTSRFIWELWRSRTAELV